MKPLSLRWLSLSVGWVFASLLAGKLSAAPEGQLSIDEVGAGANYIEFAVKIKNTSTAGETLYIQAPGALRIFHGAAIVPAGSSTWSFAYIPGTAAAALAPAYASLGTTYNLSYTASSRLMVISYPSSVLGNASAPVNCPLPAGQDIQVGKFRLTRTNGDLVGGASVDLTWFRTSAFTAFVGSGVTATNFNSTANRALVLAPPFATPGAPILGAAMASDILGGSATLGGDVTSDGGYPVTERGVVYSATSDNNMPEIGGVGVTKVTASGTTGAFGVPVSGLAGRTSYRFRAYAINQGGTTYSSVDTFTTLSSIQAWRKTHFGTSNGVGNAANNSVGFPNGNGDKLTNLEKFAFGIDPATDIGSSLVSVSGNTVTRGKPNVMFQGGPSSGLNAKARFVRRKAHVSDGLTYTVKFSADLVTWQNSTVSPASVANDGDYEVVEVPYILSVNGRKATFFKVEVSIAP